MKHQKDYKSVLVEYVAGLSDNDLRILTSKLVERYVGDLADALNFMSQRQAIDSILEDAPGPEELYQLCDVIRDIAVQQCKKRKTNYND